MYTETESKKRGLKEEKENKKTRKTPNHKLPRQALTVQKTNKL